MTHSRNLRVGIKLALLMSLSPSMPSRAAPDPATATDTASASLDEIVISARKRDERLIDIPESIAVVTPDDLTKHGIETIEDLGHQTPNLQMNMRQDLTTNVVIRGIGAYGDVLGVGFVIDDVPNFTDQTMRLEDLESVEILKGPQGTLYGGSSVGGLVRYVSKKPEFNWQGEVSAEMGNYSHLGFFGAQNIPLIDNVLALRVSGYDVKDDGFIRNSDLAINNANALTDYGVRAELLYKANDNFDALLTLRHSYIQNGGDMYLPVPSVNAYTYDARFFQPNVNTRKTDGVVLEMNDTLPFAKLTSISSFTRSQSAFNVDITQTAVGQPGSSYYTRNGNRPTEVTTQELRLTSPSGGTFEWLVGAYGAIIKNVLVNDLGSTTYPDGVASVLYDFDTKRLDTALFGNLTYHVGQFSVDAGVRLARTNYDAQIWTETGGLPNQRGTSTSRAALPKVSVSYALPNGGTVYATYAKGQEPGAVNTVSTAPLPYKAQTTSSYEIGTKGEALDRALTYEVAAFYIRNNDQQYQTNLLDPINNVLVALTSNIGSSRSYGLETSLNYKATDEWRFGVSGGYLNSAWIHANYFGSPIDGLQVPNAPRVSASTNVAYTKPVFSHLRFDANFDVNYTDAMWWDLPNTPGTKETPHFMSNLRVAIGEDGRGWQAALRISNLFGQNYWTEYIPQYYPNNYPCPNCTDIAVPGARRQVLAQFSYKY